MQSKIRDLIKQITNNPDDYDKKYLKIKFNSDDDLPLDKTQGLCNMIILFDLLFMKAKNISNKFS